MSQSAGAHARNPAYEELYNQWKRRVDEDYTKARANEPSFYKNHSFRIDHVFKKDFAKPIGEVSLDETINTEKKEAFEGIMKKRTPNDGKAIKDSAIKAHMDDVTMRRIYDLYVQIKDAAADLKTAREMEIQLKAQETTIATQPVAVQEQAVEVSRGVALQIEDSVVQLKRCKAKAKKKSQHYLQISLPTAGSLIFNRKTSFICCIVCCSYLRFIQACDEAIQPTGSSLSAPKLLEDAFTVPSMEILRAMTNTGIASGLLASVGAGLATQWGNLFTTSDQVLSGENVKVRNEAIERALSIVTEDKRAQYLDLMKSSSSGTTERKLGLLMDAIFERAKNGPDQFTSANTNTLMTNLFFGPAVLALHQTLFLAKDVLSMEKVHYNVGPVKGGLILTVIGSGAVSGNEYLLKSICAGTHFIPGFTTSKDVVHTQAQFLRLRHNSNSNDFDVIRIVRIAMDMMERHNTQPIHRSIRKRVLQYAQGLPFDEDESQVLNKSDADVLHGIWDAVQYASDLAVILENIQAKLEKIDPYEEINSEATQSKLLGAYAYSALGLSASTQTILHYVLESPDLPQSFKRQSFRAMGQSSAANTLKDTFKSNVESLASTAESLASTAELGAEQFTNGIKTWLFDAAMNVVRDHPWYTLLVTIFGALTMVVLVEELQSCCSASRGFKVASKVSASLAFCYKHAANAVTRADEQKRLEDKKKHMKNVASRTKTTRNGQKLQSLPFPDRIRDTKSQANEAPPGDVEGRGFPQSWFSSLFSSSSSSSSEPPIAPTTSAAVAAAVAAATTPFRFTSPTEPTPPALHTNAEPEPAPTRVTRSRAARSSQAQTQQEVGWDPVVKPPPSSPMNIVLRR